MRVKPAQSFVVLGAGLLAASVATVLPTAVAFVVAPRLRYSSPAATATATALAATRADDAAAAAAALPAGWQSAVDPTTGKSYYYNVETSETSWEPPAASADPGGGPPSPVAVDELTSARARAMELQRKLETAAKEIAVLKGENDGLKSSAQARAAEIAELEAKLERAAKEIAALREEKDRSKEDGTDTKVAEIAAVADVDDDIASTASVSAAAPVAPVVATEEQLEALRMAVLQVDADKVTSFLDSGIPMDEETTEAAFWAVVNEVDRAERADEPLSADVPQMLHHIYDADLEHLLTREQIRTNLTCMQPTQSGLTQQGMAYIFDDSAAKDLPLSEGRRCEDGQCCDACSRNIFPTFASDAESSLETFPELTSLTFNALTDVSAKTILQFVRLIERVRRTMAHEYGLPLKTILPLQAYSRKYVAGTTQQGGGGGEGDFVTLHTDEATHSGYHYSCVLYLSTKGKGFEGGDFVFNDPEPKKDSKDEGAKAGATSAEDDDDDDNVDDEDDDDGEWELSGESLADQIRKAGRKLTPYEPQRGAAVIFSSGWENMHEVEKITSGTRYAVPCFFTTCPVPEIAYDQMKVGKPKSNEDIADDWLHLLLAHREESPVESMGRVKELLMKWHYMCAPLSEH